jgi:phage FluMu protein Com
MGNSGAGCYFHASKEAVGSCVNCGKLICRARHSEIDGKSYCPRCIEKLFSTVQSGTPVTPSKSSGKQKQTATPVSSVTSDKGVV